MMMKYLYLALILLLIACNSRKTADVPRPVPEFSHEKEQEYIARRNRNVDYFKGKNEEGLARRAKNDHSSEFISDDLYRQMNDSLAVLENSLRSIMGNTRIDSINKIGKINLETLFPEEMGFGMLDGLTIQKQSLSILCTTKYLFLDFFIKYHIDKLDNLMPKDFETIINHSMNVDAFTTDLSSFQIISTQRIKAYGMIGVVGQDIGPYPPDHLYVLISTDNHVYLIEKPIKKKLHQLAKCKKAWDILQRRSRAAFDKYRASDLTDTSSRNESSALENQAWTAYCDCYRKNFQNDEQFPLLKKEIDEMVKLILF